MVKTLKQFIDSIKATQNARDMFLAEAEDAKDNADKLTAEIIDAISFLKAVQGHLHDENAEAMLKAFLDEVENGADK